MLGAERRPRARECLSGLEGGYGCGALRKASFQGAEARVQALRASLAP